MRSRGETAWRPLPETVRKRAAHLLTPKGRRKSGLFLVEGFRLLEEAVARRWPIESVIVRDDRGSCDRLRSLLGTDAPTDARVYTAAAGIIAELSATVEPSGVIALAQQSAPSTESNILPGPRLVLADNVRDPGNLGAILRSAAAFRVDALYLSAGTVDPYNPKAVRASMGALFRVPIHARAEAHELGERARRSGLAILVADPHEGLRPEQIECPAGWLLVIGGETEGYSADWRTLGGRPVHIPMADEVESLNSAVAAGIILFCLAEGGVPANKPDRGGRVRSS